MNKEKYLKYIRQEICRIITNKIDSLKDEIIKELDKREGIKQVSQKKSEERDDFKNITEAYEMYKELSERGKNSLSNILKGNNIEQFMVCGSQWNTIESLWEYIRNEVIENRQEDLKNLKGIFKYFFNLYALYDGENYCFQDIPDIERFDTEKYIAHPKGKSAGKVGEILLKGYINKRRGKIEKKSVVLVD